MPVVLVDSALLCELGYLFSTTDEFGSQFVDFDRVAECIAEWNRDVIVIVCSIATLVLGLKGESDVVLVEPRIDDLTSVLVQFVSLLAVHVWLRWIDATSLERSETVH